jgi:hypothetical protein
MNNAQNNPSSDSGSSGDEPLPNSGDNEIVDTPETPENSEVTDNNSS